MPNPSTDNLSIGLLTKYPETQVDGGQLVASKTVWQAGSMAWWLIQRTWVGFPALAFPFNDHLCL